jgi:predicted nucleic acid-binding protein/antitoxin (DNA-binding transcriptional repressor) of toxin-antitoxin stability system
METIGTFEAKTHLTRLLQRVAAGEEFIITRQRRTGCSAGAGQDRGVAAAARDHRQIEAVQQRSDTRRAEDQGPGQRRTAVTGFVVDASAALAWCFADEANAATNTLLDRFEGEHAVVPSSWHLELANALAVGERKERMTPARISEFIAPIGELPIVVDLQTGDLGLGQVFDLARSERLSAYDASYLELAMRRALPLATKDGDLANAARRVGVALLPTA